MKNIVNPNNTSYGLNSCFSVKIGITLTRIIGTIMKNNILTKDNLR